MGWQIVRHSFELLFRNLGSAIKVSIGPVVLMVLFLYLTTLALGLTASQVVFAATVGTPTVSMLIALIAALVALVFVSAWVAVGWHRFILLEEYPGIVPSITGKPIWPYAGRSVVLGLVMILAIIPAMIVIGVLGQVFGAETPGVALMLGFALGVYFSYIWLRIALVLPATAVERALTLAESWKATAPFSSAILGASAILVAFNIGASTLVGLLSGGMISLVIDLLVNWVTLMIGTSILTTLYGHVIEKRPLG